MAGQRAERKNQPYLYVHLRNQQVKKGGTRTGQAFSSGQAVRDEIQVQDFVAQTCEFH